MMNSHGLGMSADRNFDQRWTVAAGEGAPQRLPQIIRSLRAHRRGAEAFGEGNEIGIGEVAGNEAVAVVFLLDAADIAERAVVEYHRHQRNAMTHGGCHLVCREQKAAVAADRQHRHVAPRVLRAERRGEAVAEIVLVAGRNISAWAMNRKR